MQEHGPHLFLVWRLKHLFVLEILQEGDVIAYRVVELSSSWTPELSSYRVGFFFNKTDVQLIIYWQGMKVILFSLCTGWKDIKIWSRIQYSYTGPSTRISSSSWEDRWWGICCTTRNIPLWGRWILRGILASHFLYMNIFFFLLGWGWGGVGDEASLYVCTSLSLYTWRGCSLVNADLFVFNHRIIWMRLPKLEESD